MAPIPITIITGFLGSGKTTLILNLVPQLLAKNPDYKLALLKNEFGDLAVDSQLATSSSVSGVQELLNGCICCNLVGQLRPALLELRDTVRPQRIIVETSGSAFPATLALEVNRIARETGEFALDGVVSVIDVENWAGYEDTSYTARVQARYTDLIVFNKWETAGDDRYEECLDRVGDLEVDVAKVKSDRGHVGMELVFGIDGGLAQDLTEADVQEDHSHHPHAETDGKPHGHQSEVEVLSVELKPPSSGPASPSSPNASQTALKKLLTSAPKDEIYRIKAVLNLTSPPQSSDLDGPQSEPSPSGRYILNWAFGRWTFTPLAETETEHTSSSDSIVRMTIVTGRHESNKWHKKLEAGGLVELEGDGQATLDIKRLV